MLKLAVDHTRLQEAERFAGSAPRSCASGESRAVRGLMGPSWSAGFGRCRLLELASERPVVWCAPLTALAAVPGPLEKGGEVVYRVSFLMGCLFACRDLLLNLSIHYCCFVYLCYSLSSQPAGSKCNTLSYNYTLSRRAICVSTAKQLAVTTGEWTNAQSAWIREAAVIRE